MGPYFTQPIATGSEYQVLNSDDHVHPTLQFKVVIVGDSGCGKTSLFSSYIRGSFPISYEPTIFENHRTFVLNLQSNDILSADLWDTAGQEEYERLRRLSYQDANVVIVAYSMDAPESLPNIHEVWAPEVMTYAPNASIILVGLKSDMIHKIDPIYASNIAESIGAVAHIPCSSIQMKNVNELFNCVFNTAYNKEKMRKHHQSIQSKNRNSQLHSDINNNNNNYDNNNSQYENNNLNNKRNSFNSFSSKKLKRKSKCTIL
jgi:small GTP-binding protein